MPEFASHTPNEPITWASPWSWLVRGWHDLWYNPAPSLMHGLMVSLFGGLLFWCARDQFWWLLGAFTGFLIVAPVLATGVYAISRAADDGRHMGCTEVLHLWRGRDPRLVTFGLLLGAAGTGWVLTSAGLITLWSEAPVHRPIDFLRFVVLSHNTRLFEAWVMLGGLLAAPMFASSVLTLPMLVDTEVPVWRAVGESWRAVANYPLPMAVWAVVIVLLVGVGLMTALLGLVWIVPLLGHASWHAYRDVTRAAAAAPRMAAAR